ncbi:UNKNOWN [Stylonychia lemnae]|uniref:Uncharacterized protein n=1 Tax=Stylonychia lemnae TaxID=5949 RepID=A0A078AS60_STYLE|nr:UNKNOWN [Stylonychia lemnae]|eukprot:CDW83723.1 UNKNOWN [Stylonychia lemnae]
MNFPTNKMLSGLKGIRISQFIVQILGKIDKQIICFILDQYQTSLLNLITTISTYLAKTPITQLCISDKDRTSKSSFIVSQFGGIIRLNNIQIVDSNTSTFGKLMTVEALSDVSFFSANAVNTIQLDDVKVTQIQSQSLEIPIFKISTQTTPNQEPNEGALDILILQKSY